MSDSLTPATPSSTAPLPSTAAAVPAVSADSQYKITLLLKEYDTLRQEITSRVSSRFTLITIGAAVGTIVGLKDGPLANQGLALVLLWLAAVALLWIRTARLIVSCSRRIAEIEGRINQLAGDELLVWETRNRQLNPPRWWQPHNRPPD